KHPPGSIPDGSNSTCIGKSTCSYVAVYSNCGDLKAFFRWDEHLRAVPDSKFRKKAKIKNDLTRDMHFESDHPLFRYQCWCCFCNRIYFDILIIILYNIFILLSFFCHSVGTVLTHANSMTKTFRCKDKMIVFLFNGKITGL